MKQKNQIVPALLSALLVSVTVLVLFTGCKDAAPEVKIAEQWGAAYFPLQIMKEKGLLEKHLQGSKIEWVKMNNAASIREGIAAGKVDIGFMGVPPFLIGADKGMGWKIFTGLSSVPLGLTAKEFEIRELSDFTDAHRIALPQPGSIQHILLAMACKRELNNAAALDHLLVTMSHPDGMNALLSGGDITAHFTSVPFLTREKETPGFLQVLSGREAFGGDFTFIVGVVRKDFPKENRESMTGFLKALEEGIAYIRQYPEEAAIIGSNRFSIPLEEMERYLSDSNIIYSTEVTGVQKFADFMNEQGYLSGKLDAAELFFE